VGTHFDTLHGTMYMGEDGEFLGVVGEAHDWDRKGSYKKSSLLREKIIKTSSMFIQSVTASKTTRFMGLHFCQRS